MVPNATATATLVAHLMGIGGIRRRGDQPLEIDPSRPCALNAIRCFAAAYSIIAVTSNTGGWVIQTARQRLSIVGQGPVRPARRPTWSISISPRSAR
jgi:hypothetical protein